MTKVFVYGTLKKGHRANHLLDDAEFLGGYETEPCFTMYDLTSYPAVSIGGTTPILGEVYEVDDSTLRKLDAYEGYPTLYQKHTLQTIYGDVDMYVMDRELAQQYSNNSFIQDGVW